MFRHDGWWSTVVLGRERVDVAIVFHLDLALHDTLAVCPPDVESIIVFLRRLNHGCYSLGELGDHM